MWIRSIFIFFSICLGVVQANSGFTFIGDSHMVIKVLQKTITKEFNEKAITFASNIDQASSWMVKDIYELSQNAPRKAYFIGFGTNELNVGISPKNYVNSLKYIVMRIREWDEEANIFILTPIPLLTLNDNNKLLIAYEKTVDKEFKNYDYLYVIHLRDCANNLTYSSDNIHLKYKDYEKLGICVAKEIKNIGVLDEN